MFEVDPCSFGSRGFGESSSRLLTFHLVLFQMAARVLHDLAEISADHSKKLRKQGDIGGGDNFFVRVITFFCVVCSLPVQKTRSFGVAANFDL